VSGLCGVFQDALGVKFPPLDTDEARQVSLDYVAAYPIPCTALMLPLPELMSVAAPSVVWVGAG
jgi:hypothetical protein